MPRFNWYYFKRQSLVLFGRQLTLRGIIKTPIIQRYLKLATSLPLGQS
jgi:hypothetical protein